jgi:RNA polymerase sigma-70 factor, ECF subfamily
MTTSKWSSANGSARDPVSGFRPRLDAAPPLATLPLLRRAEEGDMSTIERAEPAAADDFADVYQDQLAAVWRYVRSRVWAYHDAQDVTAEVFTRAWRAWPSYDSRRGPVAPWLFRIAQRTVVDWLRRRERRQASPASGMPALEGAPASLTESIEAALLDEEVLTRLGWALAELSERERDCVALRFAGGLKMAEIAEVLGSSTGAAKMAVSRAIRHLADSMARLEVESAEEAPVALDELIEELVVEGRMAVPSERLQELMVHLSAVHQPPLPRELPGRVAACVACAGRIRAPDEATAEAAGRSGRTGGLLDALGIAPLTGFSWAALAPICLSCTVYPLGTAIISLGLGVDVITGVHLFTVATGPLVLWVLFRHRRRHRDPFGIWIAGVGALGLAIHLALHVLPGLEAGWPFTISDQAGTALVLAGALVDWHAMRSWMGNQREKLAAVAPALAAGTVA